MRRLLQLSLVLNVVLLGATWWRADLGGGAVNATRAVPRDAPAFRRPARTVTEPIAPPTPWAALDSADPARLMANLRAIGCPEQTIRELAGLRICRAYRQRLLAAEVWAAQAWDYTRNQDAREWRERRFERDRLHNEMVNEVESLLGVPFALMRASMFGWPRNAAEDLLSADKRRSVREIQLKYRELTDELSTAGHLGWLDAEDRAQLEEWSREEQAELASVLTPAEIEERFYRESAAARYVQQNLPAAKSEAEFRAMVRLADEYGLANQPVPMGMRYGIPGLEEDPAWQDYQQRKAAFDARLEEVLGEERIAEQAAAEQQRLEAELERQRVEGEQQALREMTAMRSLLGLARRTPNVSSSG